MHQTGLEKTPIATIREKMLQTIGEYKVVPPDILVRFLDTKETMEEYLISPFEEALNATLALFPKIPAREELELTIPMGHRYTKFLYVVDPQTLYIPYHYHEPTLYGIYFREKQIYKDARILSGLAWNLLKDDRFFERLKIPEVDRSNIRIFMKHPLLGFSTLVTLYIEALYFHALAHHVVEDISTLLELNNLGEYSIIKDSREEESFCEFIMYDALQNIPSPGVAYKLLCKLRDGVIIPPVSLDDIARFLRSYRRAFAAALYIHRSKTIYKDYQFMKPAVSEEVAKKILPIFKGLWYTHIFDLEPVETGEEITRRIYAINL